jgi:hypothetical protein
LVLALEFTSLLTGISLKQGITASCAIDVNGNLSLVLSLGGKIRAAKAAGLHTSLVSTEQTTEEPIETAGINIIIPV